MQNLNEESNEKTIIDSFLLGFQGEENRRNTADTLNYSQNILTLNQDEGNMSSENDSVGK